MAKTAAEYAKERYCTLKAQKKCVQCGKADDRTRAGMTHCVACADYARNYNRNMVAERVANDLCIRCGKKSYGYSLCKKCRVKRAERYRNSKK